MLKLFLYTFSLYSLARVRLSTYTFSLVFIIFLGLPSTLFAKDMANEIILPDNVKNTFDIRPFVSIGEATFSVLFWDIYKSRLLTTTGSYPIEASQDSLLFDINYLTDISSKDLIKRTIEQWQHIGIATDKYTMYLPILSSIWPDIKDGDSLSLLIEQDRSIFYFNNTYIGVINNKDFGQMFIDIWLSEKTSQPRLRRDLLGD